MKFVEMPRVGLLAKSPIIPAVQVIAVNIWCNGSPRSKAFPGICGGRTPQTVGRG